ncbi:MAG: metallophosphoesterase [Fimbriimonadaceae bacterium]|nr:metallophosphoesterase [Alphaproteobacteria bacterium]
MFTLAHLSDVHLALRVTPSIADLVNKRVTGFVNLRGNRSDHHQDWVINALVADLKAAKPDHVALTGDLINLALADEFINASEWLAAFGAPDWISLVPGNHDTYVRRQPGEGIDLWQAYMRGDDDQTNDLTFPYLRRRGDVAVIGLSSAITTRPFMATGKLGQRQLDEAYDLLKSAGAQGLCRVVLIHHPPLVGLSPRHKRLTDAAKFAGMIGKSGAELILHGHNHTDTVVYTPGDRHPVPVVGVPSASSLGYKSKPAAQYNLFKFSRSGAGWKLEMMARRLDPRSRIFFDVEKRILLPPQKNAG